jgi:DHA2 family multidrug resistance protein
VSGAGAPLKGGQLAITALALALGTFTQVLDTTIANVSLPTIAGDLGSSTDQGTWVITSFAVANGVSVPLTGWLMGRFGVVRTFVFSLAAFTVASFLCGMAWNLPVLIFFRILQGALSGPVIPGSQALLISIFPPQRRSMAIGIWSITTLVAPVAGPILGGYISDNYHWGWIFFINVPIGLFCCAVCWRNLAARETPTRKLPIDAVGLGLLVLWVGALQVMLDNGKNADWFASPMILTLAIVTVIGFAAWAIWEWTDDHPIVDLSLFENRNFAFGTLALCLGFGLFFATIVVQSLWLQVHVGYTATWAGLVLAPSGMVAVLLTPICARLLGRIDARIAATTSFVLLAASFFMRAGYTDDADYFHLVLPLLVQGMALSVFMISLLTICLEGVPHDRIPAASGIANFARITGGGFAASLMNSFWDRREALHQSRLAETPTVYNPVLRNALDQLQNHGVSQLRGVGLLTRRLVGQANLIAINDVFWFAGFACLAMIVLVWMSRRSISDAPAIGGE